MLACNAVLGWLASALPTQLRLTSNEMIWPDGRPRALSQHGATVRQNGGQEVPVLNVQPGYRRARLVRNQRRSFLVYDGGLTGDGYRDND